MQIPTTKDEAFEAVVELAVEGLRIQQQLKAFDDLKARQAQLGEIAGWYLSHPLLAGVDMAQITETAQLLLDNEVKDSAPAEPEAAADQGEKPKRRRRTKAQIEADKAAEAAAKDGHEVVNPTPAAEPDITATQDIDVQPQSDEDAERAWAAAEPSPTPGKEYDPFAAPDVPDTGSDGTPLDPFAAPQGAQVSPGAPAPWESAPSPTSGSGIGSPFD